MLSFGSKTEIRSKSDPITLLKGCGKVTIKKLNLNGIYTYQHMLDFRGDIPGVNILTLQKTAIQEVKTTKEISEHNWKDRVGHVIRARGQVTRAIIENLVIGPHLILLNVRWKVNGKILRKAVSPISLLCTQVMWLSSDIISDDSDDDSCQHMDSILPKFLVDTESSIVQNLTSAEQEAIHSVIKETNQLYNCVYQSLPSPLSRK